MLDRVNPARAKRLLVRLPKSGQSPLIVAINRRPPRRSDGQIEVAVPVEVAPVQVVHPSHPRRTPDWFRRHGQSNTAGLAASAGGNLRAGAARFALSALPVIDKNGIFDDRAIGLTACRSPDLPGDGRARVQRNDQPGDFSGSGDGDGAGKRIGDGLGLRNEVAVVAALNVEEGVVGEMV